jgi:hypothetical protein
MLLTIVFIAAILIYAFYEHLHFDAKAAINAPTICTTFGIFATFTGIAIGLSSFDPQDITNSMPLLLDGLKTAFWASVVGIFMALTFKFRLAKWGIPSRYQGQASFGATIDDLVSNMKNVQQALVGSDESTLISQLKLSRQDVNDRLDALKKSQHEFMEKMADNNSKALIQALQEVIRDFNAKINEQFGENFKQLNSAVGELLRWQEQYRQQMAEMIEQQTKSASNMATATDRYGVILEKAESFTSTATKMSSLLDQLIGQRSQIENNLKALGSLLVAAEGSLPKIEQKILELTEQMTRGVHSSNEETMKAIKESSANMQSTLVETRTMMVNTVQAANLEFNSHITTITNKTKEQVAVLDVALEQELTKSLNTMARQLSALSQKFVEDYTPLTEKLQALLSAAKGL